MSPTQLIFKPSTVGTSKLAPQYTIFKDGTNTKSIDANGTVISNEADAAVVIQAVIDLNPTGLVFFKEGIYDVSTASLKLQNDHEYHFQGSGFSTVLITTGAGAVFETVDSGNNFYYHHCIIEDMTIAAANGYGLRHDYVTASAYACPWFIIKNVQFGGRVGANTYYVKYGVKTQHPYKFFWDHVWFYTNNANSIAIWFYSGAAGHHCGDSSFHHIQINASAAGRGILIDVTTGGVDATINEMSWHFIEISGVDTAIDFKASDNTAGNIQLMNFYQLDIEGDTAGLLFETPAASGARGNIGEINFWGGYWQSPIVQTGGQGCGRIRFNDIKMMSGCTMTTNGDNIMYFDSCFPHEMTISGGTPKIDCNNVYTLKNSGTSTGTGAQQTIAHGLKLGDTTVAVVPDIILLTEGTTGGALAYQSAAADLTNIYVTATLNKTYGWFVMKKGYLIP